MFIGMKHISFTFRYIIPMYLRLTTFAKTLPQMSFHLMCCYLFPLWGSTHNSADCWSAHRSPASRDARPRHLQTCARLMQAGSLRPGAPPHQQKSWLRWRRNYRKSRTAWNRRGTYSMSIQLNRFGCVYSSSLSFIFFFSCLSLTTFIIFIIFIILIGCTITQ